MYVFDPRRSDDCSSYMVEVVESHGEISMHGTFHQSTRCCFKPMVVEIEMKTVCEARIVDEVDQSGA